MPVNDIKNIVYDEMSLIGMAIINQYYITILDFNQNAPLYNPVQWVLKFNNLDSFESIQKRDRSVSLTSIPVV
jgi:hypothetical protein